MKIGAASSPGRGRGMMQISRVVPAHRAYLRAIWVHKHFSHYNEAYRRARRSVRPNEGPPLCFWCSHPFEEDEPMALVGRDRGLSVLVCEECADALLASDRQAVARSWRQDEAAAKGE